MTEKTIKRMVDYSRDVLKIVTNLAKELEGSGYSGEKILEDPMYPAAIRAELLSRVDNFLTQIGVPSGQHDYRMDVYDFATHELEEYLKGSEDSLVRMELERLSKVAASSK